MKHPFETNQYGLTPLEAELLFQVRKMSAVLQSAGILIKTIAPADILALSLADDCDKAAEYSDRMKKFEIMAQFNYL